VYKRQVHYAALLKLRGSLEAVNQYQEDPDTDFHQMVADMTNIVRKLAKYLNLGLSYGMGIKKFAATYNIPYKEAAGYYDQYHKGLPFIKELTKRTEKAAKARGFVKTILGRHSHFDLYGPRSYEEGDKPLKYEAARDHYSDRLPIVRWFTYRAMNRVIQGSAADMIKKSMIDCYRAGYVPSITVHDELDFCDLESPDQLIEIHDIMRDAIPLLVPNKVDCEIGQNWGELEEVMV